MSERRLRQQGMTLLEIIIVIALMGIIYTVAMPNLSSRSTSEAATKLGQLATDVRGAFDMAVLYRQPYRLVFNFVSGEYWLETTYERDFYLGDDKLDRDPTEEEVQEAAAKFDEDFETYVELAGKEVRDPDNDRIIKPTSPVVAAKDRLRPVKWTRVETREWGVRSLGPVLIIEDMQAEHHREKQTAGELAEKARGFLYFFPAGYVERMVMHVAFRKGDSEIDENQLPYIVRTNPYSGTATVTSGNEEYNVADYETE